MFYFREGIRARIDNFWPGLHETKTEHFTDQDAIEALRLVANAGESGQAPVLRYKQGDRVILNKLKPGTILREKTEHIELGARYHWWCVGGITSSGELTLYSVTSQHGPILEQEENMRIHKTEKIKPSEKNRDILFTVGNKGVLTDLCLSQNPNYEKPEYGELRELPDKRFTNAIEVIKWGKTEKQPAEQKVVNRLVSLRTRAAASSVA